MLKAIKKFPAKSTKAVTKTVKNAQNRFLVPEKLVQAGRTPYEVIYQEEIVQLRYYPPLIEDVIEVDGEQVNVERNSLPLPLVIVAPLAANMYIYDLFQDRSLIRYLRAKGFEIYLLDWGNPSWSENHYTLETYFANKMPRLLEKVRQHSGQQKLSLHGWSLGGLFSVCYAGMGDPDIENLVLLGAPCDYHANGQLGKHYQSLNRAYSWIRSRTGWKVYQSPKRFWRSPGWMNSLAFKLTDPIGSIQGYMELVAKLHDEEFVTKHATNGAFLDNMVAYPGGVGQDIFHHLCTGNVLAKKRLPIKSKDNQMQSITANMMLVCGDNDPIVTRDNSIALLNIVDSDDVLVHDVSGGHMGIVSGTQAPSSIWPQIVEWLAPRSVLS